MTESDRRVLHVEGLAKSYGSRLIIADVSFYADPREVVCIVGPSGAGKTTLLRCIAQLTQPSEGTVMLHGRVITSPPREMAVVFQDYSRSLMPWLKVSQNVGLPLKSMGLSREEREKRVADAVSAVGLGDFLNHFPWQLSGGMQQRVAIARALAYGPEVLIMDEPFASVDAQTRAELEDLVLELRSNLGVTVVLVTHDIDEAVYMADRVVVLSGSPAQVTESVDIPLGRKRDQILTKESPDFISNRSHVARLIMNAKVSTRVS
ncbi:ABC transporter ATP-binding protein [Georgenia sp. H159]|uniref:ABC transporter ATP-binding protein n=1 Tax=Georgenia sp. H159 TaxID=3076115 RepID=UPI002D7910C0|nr:ABC transporter ATP-binding protein [Georgenia sp. H159]